MKIYLPLYLLLCLGLFTGPLSVNAQIKMTPDRVGFFTDTPEFDVDIRGDLFVRSNFGGINLGYSNNGNQWKMATINGGEDVLYRFKPAGSNTFTTRMILLNDGGVSIGGTSTFRNAELEVVHNSRIADPQLLLTEQGTDFARLSFENTTYSGKRWTIAGYPGSSPGTSKLNFWFEDANGGTDIVTIEGEGNVGIMGTNPSARLHIHQRGQSVGLGLRFDDGTANADWDITHGFGLRLHYGGSLRGTFSATTGAYIQASDGRLKKNIQKMPDILSKVLELRPLTYQYKGTKAREATIGFVAQEVLPLFPELVHYSEADELYGVNYGGFSVVAIKAIQELKAEIDGKDERIAELEERLARIEKLLTQDQRAQNLLVLEAPPADLERPSLDQNAPNPFSGVTTISYFIPEGVQNAQLRIADVNGRLLKSMEVDQRGQVQTTLDAQALTAGTYYYSLYVDGQMVSTRKMVIK